MDTRNMKYICKDCNFDWISLNGEQSICPKCHSDNIQFLREIKELNLKDKNNNKKEAIEFINKLTAEHCASCDLNHSDCETCTYNKY